MTSLDHKVISLLTVILLLLFTFVTISTWMKLPNLSDRDRNVPFFEMSSASLMHLHPPSVTPPSPKQGQISSGQSPPSEHGQRHHALYKLEDIMDIETLKHTFPIHVGYDRGNQQNMEEIDHPGALLSTPNDFKERVSHHPELKYKMMVPKFWRPPHPFGPDGVRAYLGNHGQNLITPEQADAIGSFDENGMETIYVSVASYRDPECRLTVDDLYLRAKHPDRIRVAIIDQVVDGDAKCSQPDKPCSDDPTQVFCKYRHLIDVFEVPAILR